MAEFNIPFFLSLVCLFISVTTSQEVIDITTLGAEDGGDATQAMMDAWTKACESTEPVTISVPAGEYNMGPVKFTGPSAAPITWEIAGNFKSPSDPAQMNGADCWVKFERTDDLTINVIEGGGVFDGQGKIAWTQNDCANTALCDNLPYNFRFNFLNRASITGLTSLDSKLYHMAILQGNDVTLKDITITAPGDSLNTDGIHIGRSENIKIIGATIGTGDDCISMGDDVKDIHIESITCGPGHGISIGSLGRYKEEKPVTGVTIKGCTLKDTDNGVRIKTWLDFYPTTASDLHFEDITCENVGVPILIDQEYCPYNHCKSKTPSKVKLSNISFKNIKGTASREEAVKLICSSGTPCEGISLEDIDLTYNGGPALLVCKNVEPQLAGTMNPEACNAPEADAAAAGGRKMKL